MKAELIQYMHLKTGNIYQVCDWIEMKENGEWVNGVLYYNVEHPERKFARAEEDFLAKFSKVC